MIVNAPTPGVGGNWFRAAYGINRDTLSVTAWAAGHIQIPISDVVSAWFPLDGPDTAVDPSVEDIKKQTGVWRFKELKLDVVDYIVSS
mgnify:FL=1